MSTASAQHSTRITPEEVARYAREGWIAPTGPVLPADEFASLRAHFERMLEDLAPGKRPESMDVPHFADPALLHWLLHPAVLDLVEPLIGPDIALFSSHFICKPGGDGKRVPWHEDSSYWRDMFASRDDIQVATVWLAIDESRIDNGAMRVIPGTHGDGFSEYDAVPDPEVSVFSSEIRPHCRDASRAVTIELQPNHASIHHAKLMHGSERNTSSRRRCAYTMRYVSTRCRLRHEYCGEWHGIYLARGRDHAGNRYLDPSQPAPARLLERGSHIRRGH